MVEVSKHKMRRPKLYFHSIYETHCHSLEFYKEKLIEWNAKMMELTEAVPSIGDGTFYCKEYGIAGLIEDSGCGKSCEKYKPCNGKSGRCRFSTHCYEDGIKKFKLGKDGLTEIK